MPGNLGIIASGYSATSSSPPVVASSTVLAEDYVVGSTTINKPSGVVSGDLIVIFTNIETAENTVTISGFTKRVERSDNNAYVIQATVFTKVATGSEGSTFTINVANDTNVSAIALRITGANTSTPYDTSATATSFGDYVLERNFSTITTGYANELVLGCLAQGDPLDNESISGWTKVTNTTGTYVYYRNAVAAGSISQTDFDQPTTYDMWISFAVGIRS